MFALVKFQEPLLRLAQREVRVPGIHTNGSEVWIIQIGPIFLVKRTRPTLLQIEFIRRRHSEEG